MSRCLRYQASPTGDVNTKRISDSLARMVHNIQGSILLVDCLKITSIFIALSLAKTICLLNCRCSRTSLGRLLLLDTHSLIGSRTSNIVGFPHSFDHIVFFVFHYASQETQALQYHPHGGPGSPTWEESQDAAYVRVQRQKWESSFSSRRVCVVTWVQAEHTDMILMSRFYQSGSSNASTPPTQQNLNKLFDQYRGEFSLQPQMVF